MKITPWSLTLISITLICSQVSGQFAQANTIYPGEGEEKETSFSSLSFGGTVCRLPIKPPPKDILTKKFLVGGYSDGFLPKWHQVDLDGDGICDMIRDGIESSIYDQEIPKSNGFIIFGKYSDWRVWKPQISLEKTKDFGGLMPIAAIVKKNGNSRPYIVFYNSTNSANPSIDIKEFSVTQWDVSASALVVVDEKLRMLVLNFLNHELCISKPKYSIAEGVTDRITAKGPDSLCGR